MSTTCYTPIRGSALRVTELSSAGAVPSPVRYATSKSVVRVSVHEVVEQPGNEIIANPEDERRLKFHRHAQTIRHTVDIEFIRVDPGVLNLVAGVGLAYRDGDVVGFDSGTRNRVTSFALEVWSKLDARTSVPLGPGFGEGAFGEDPFGRGPCTDRLWGYTLFPHLRGGRISGFTFKNGLVSFDLVGAQTRKVSRWGVGPYDLEGPFERLITPVSRNVSYRTFVMAGAPPAQTDGVQETTDVLDNGTASNPMPDPDAALVVDGGGADTQPWVIDGGRA